MSQVLVDHESCQCGPDNHNELTLGEVFNRRIDGDLVDFVRIPAAVRTQVDSLVDLYRRAKETV